MLSFYLLFGEAKTPNQPNQPNQASNVLALWIPPGRRRPLGAAELSAELRAGADLRRGGFWGLSEGAGRFWGLLGLVELVGFGDGVVKTPQRRRRIEKVQAFRVFGMDVG